MPVETVNAAVLEFDMLGGPDTSTVSKIRNSFGTGGPRFSERSLPRTVKVCEPSGSVSDCEPGHASSGEPSTVHVTDAHSSDVQPSVTVRSRVKEYSSVGVIVGAMWSSNTAVAAK